MPNNPNDESSKSLGVQMCHAATGEPCESLFGLSQSPFVEIGRASRPRKGDSVLLQLSDPFTVSSDVRRVLMVFDNDPTRVFKNATQAEGSTRAYDLKEDVECDFIGVWIDADDIDAVQCKTVKTSDANQIVLDSDKSAPEKVLDGLAEQAEKERVRTRNMLIGAALFVIVIAGMAAYVLPKIKLPSANIG